MQCEDGGMKEGRVGKSSVPVSLAAPVVIVDYLNEFHVMLVYSLPSSHKSHKPLLLFTSATSRSSSLRSFSNVSHKTCRNKFQNMMKTTSS
eukprot:558889-Hanusia_phi.AAC.1